MSTGRIHWRCIPCGGGRRRRKLWLGWLFRVRRRGEGEGGQRGVLEEGDPWGGVSSHPSQTPPSNAPNPTAFPAPNQPPHSTAAPSPTYSQTPSPYNPTPPDSGYPTAWAGSAAAEACSGTVFAQCNLGGNCGCWKGQRRWWPREEGGRKWGGTCLVVLQWGCLSCD